MVRLSRRFTPYAVLSAFARRYSRSRFCFPFLPLLRCFSSRGSLPRPMHSGGDDPFGPGCPIRRSQDRSLVISSPGLIADSHVLHRLSTPRHPSHALVRLVASTTSRRHHLPYLLRFGGSGFPAPVSRLRPSAPDAPPGLRQQAFRRQPETRLLWLRIVITLQAGPDFAGSQRSHRDRPPSETLREADIRRMPTSRALVGSSIGCSENDLGLEPRQKDPIPAPEREPDDGAARDVASRNVKERTNRRGRLDALGPTLRVNP